VAVRFAVEPATAYEQEGKEDPRGCRRCGGCGLVFLAVGYLISDEKGLPVPTTFAGGQCWLTTRGIDVLDCRELGRGFYVGWMGRWQPTRRCRVLNPRLLCCELPYALRIDLTGDYPRVASVPSSG
jgi:hypothetical protein